MTNITDLYAALNSAKSHIAACAILISADWTLLGRGAFSNVYGHADHAEVIKVCRCVDDGSLPFVALALEKWQSNRHYPRVYRAAIGGGWYWCAMEKLEPICRKSTITGDVLVRLNEDRNNARYVINDQARYATKSVGKELTDLCVTVRDQLAKRYCVDLHEENAMARRNANGTHTLVITDPFSYERIGGDGAITPDQINIPAIA